MKNIQLNSFSRICLAFCAAALAVVMVLPLWRIELTAPQYPEGLFLLIYPNKLGGNVDIVNGLNHYIGMKALHASDFIEFTVLPYIIGFFSALALLVAITARPKLLTVFFILFVCFGVFAMVDFWRWEYNYGHDLNPDAAIVVPGMSYQPPLIGFKQLLNFGAYSIPDTGGWIFITVGLVSLLCVWMNWKITNRLKLMANNTILVFILMSACNNGPEIILLGKDNCHFCKMTISDARYGAEIMTKKGRNYKFDDGYCLLKYLKTKDLLETEIKHIYITSFSGNHQLINVDEALFLQSKELHGPMGGDIAAFQEIDSLKKQQKAYSGNTTKWSILSK